MKSIVKHHDHIIRADSDDGRISVLNTPLTRLYGNFTIRDNVTGELMYRKEYLDSNGKICGRKVPDLLWNQVVDLMHEIEELNNAAEDASAERSLKLADERYSETSVRIAMDMDNPNSDL